MLRLSLAARITMIVITALTAVWIATIALLYLSHDHEGDGTLPSTDQIAALVVLVEQTSESERQLVLDAVSSSTLEARIADARDTQLIRPTAEGLRQVYTAVLGTRPLAIVAPPADQRLFPRLISATGNGLEFRIGLATGETLIINTKRAITVSRLGLPVGFGAGLFGTLVALVALLIMHRETLPLARLAAAVDGIDLSGPPVLLPQARGSAPEIQALIAAFNRLETRLSQLLRARMAMLGGISHDVRTFATRLRLRVDQIPEGTQRDRAIGDIADMMRLLDDALLASRAGAGELAEELVEFADIVRAEVEDRRSAGALIDLRIEAAATAATILGDRLALRRIVANLIDNALKYGHAAHLALVADTLVITLTIDDEGSGIPPDQREILLEPFVRLETSRNRRTGGAGLGLAIVRNLVEGHGGSIVISETPSGGARFTVRLPAFQVT
jgi:signal transduction histidine kinase